MYNPKPIDTSNVLLSDELLKLTEEIAENVHDVWAQGRISEGWSYGNERDLVNMKDPRLVPYDDLPDSEKEYDRNTALETIKFIVMKGCEIRKVDKNKKL